MAQTTRKQNKGMVHLRFDAGKVLITPEDYPRFQMAATQAVKVLQKENEVEEWVSRFNDEYLPYLHNWCVKNAGKVDACYLGMPTPHGLSVFVIGATEKYDFELGEEISSLAIFLEAEGWSSNVIQIPNGDDLLTFFNPETSLQVYAQPAAASAQG